MSRSILAASVLLTSVAIAGCSSPAAPPATFKVTGAVLLSMEVDQLTTAQDPEGPAVAPGCETGLTDIAPGAQVVVRDGTGKVAGVGELSKGVPTGEGLTCSFALTADVVSGQSFYSVEVARRGQTYYTAAKLREPLSINVNSVPLDLR